MRTTYKKYFFIITGILVALGILFIFPSSKIENDRIVFSVHDNTLSLTVNNEIVQTVEVDRSLFDAQMQLQDQNLEAVSQVMFLQNDVTFDGYTDIAVLSGQGMVNLFYDYYTYNPNTKRLEKDPVLTEIGNPEFDAINKTIISNYRSGPAWYQKTFRWNGVNYVAGEETQETFESLN